MANSEMPTCHLKKREILQKKYGRSTGDGWMRAKITIQSTKGQSILLQIKWSLLLIFDHTGAAIFIDFFTL